MKVAFTGPSGSGKTTLVKWVSEKYNLKWLNGSSGGLKSEEKNKELYSMGLKVGGGHRAVIQSGHMNPQAAWDNQLAISAARARLIINNYDFVTDRSHLDVLVYATIQCGPYLKDDELLRLHSECFAILNKLTHLIYVPTMLFPIEDNGSRINNYIYQKAMDGVFETFLQDYADSAVNRCKILKITRRDLVERHKQIEDFLLP